MDKKRNNNLKFPLKGKYIALVAPSFIVDFPYPKILFQLKELGFDKAVELTFGAKLVNREYYKEIKNSKKLMISSVCAGIVETIKNSFPEYKNNLLLVDSPMIATAKICKKIYPYHKRVFISPCNFKKLEAERTGLIDYVINYKELKNLIFEYYSKHTKSKKNKFYKKEIFFDKFYNDYTKIYPIPGGLSKTLKVKKLLQKNEIKEIDGIKKIIKFLKNPNPKIKFLDITFCKGGCIGGPFINSKIPISFRKRKVLKYLRKADKEKIPENRKGIFKKAEGLSFKSNYSINIYNP
jgi:iron only hydrogenase large subunit-like protein